MLIIRNVFQLKFGHAKQAKALIPAGRELMQKRKMGDARFMTDVTGAFYTLVMELSFESLAAYEKNASEVMSSKEFSDWYGKFMEHIESGHREIFSVVD